MPTPVYAANEYDTLTRVAMRYAVPFTRPLTGTGVHPVLQRQQQTSSWTSYNASLVRAQQDELIALLRARGTEVVLLPEAPGCSAQHYPRDIAFTIDHVLFRARLNSEHRQPEAEALTAASLGLPDPVRLAAGTIEGGDVMLHDACVLLGLSEETSAEGAESLQTALAEHGIDREVVPVTFSTPGVVHLDDHFVVIAPQTALIHRAAFPTRQVRYFEKRFDLIDVTDAEARAVQANVLAIAPATVVVAAGADRIAAQLVARGIEVLHVDYSEVTKIPGSLRCTTLPLNRT